MSFWEQQCLALLQHPIVIFFSSLIMTIATLLVVFLLFLRKKGDTLRDLLDFLKEMIDPIVLQSLMRPFLCLALLIGLVACGIYGLANSNFYHIKTIPVEKFSNTTTNGKEGERLVVVNYAERRKKLVVSNDNFHEKTVLSERNKKDKAVVTVYALKPKYVKNKVNLPEFKNSDVEVTHYKKIKWQKAGE